MKSPIFNWDYVGAELAVADDEQQAAFFKGFAFELGKYPTHYSREMQMFAVAKNLTEKEKEVLEQGLSCLWFKKGDK